MQPLLRTICICCFLISCSVKPSIKYLTDLEQENIKGNVTKLVTNTYNIDSTGKMEGLESENIEIFNSLGYTITDTNRNLVDKNEMVNFFIYNKNGSLSSVSMFENGNKLSRMLWEYDNTGKCTGCKIYDATDKLESYYSNISQTAHGLLKNVDSYNANGKLTMSYLNEYDSIYQIGATAKDSLGKLSQAVKIHLTAGKEPENVVETTYIKDSIINNSTSYQYKIWDKSGNWLEQTSFDEKGKAIKMTKRVFSYR